MAESIAPRFRQNAPQLTFRAVCSGMLIGALLTPCNVYSGLKIGWTFNMSVASGLIGFALWTTAQKTIGTAEYGLLENNINQTTASSAASIVSAGLVAPIPALTILTGQTLPLSVLVIWMFVVSALGVVVAAGMRNQLLFRENLPFPSGVVTAETMREIHDGGPEAHARLRLLTLAGALSAAIKFVVSGFGIAKMSLPIKFTLGSPGGGAAPIGVSGMNLGFALDPSLLMIGFGAISGLRIGASVLLGAVVGWGLLAPIALQSDWVEPGLGDPKTVWFGELIGWLLWPGVALMVTSSLTSFAISTIRLALQRREKRPPDPRMVMAGTIDHRKLIPAFVVVLIMCVIAQTSIFGIGLFEASMAVLLSYILAIVSARVSGETAITPIGALGKITQFTFAAISPSNVTANLMTANVTGGAAGQCADLMHDLRTGQMIGANPSFQIIAQVFGVLTGSLVAAITYLSLIPSPQTQLLTPEWPAPAVATWKAVAEVISVGIDALPPASLPAIYIATLIGVGLALIESVARPGVRRFIPSGSAVGLGFVIPAWNSISLFVGAVLAMLIGHFFPEWAKRRLIVVVAGLIVGESLAGVVSAIGGVLG